MCGDYRARRRVRGRASTASKSQRSNAPVLAAKTHLFVGEYESVQFSPNGAACFARLWQKFWRKQNLEKMVC